MNKVPVIVLVGIFCAVLAQDKPTVDTHYGKLQGDTGLSRGGRMFYRFRGIPYAKAPERFQVPEIPNNWEGVKDASEFGPICCQFHPKTKEVIGQEDCLVLNVYSPKLPKQGDHAVLLPVAVLLHPGSHHHGSGDKLGPKYFMDTDVILVTLNSRLGPLGYLNTGDMYAQGNMGLKDQTAALRWIQTNIEKFGGDKTRVTLVGSSAGSSDVFLHLFNPLSKGLFSGAVLQSGTALSPVPVYFTRDPIKQAKKLGTQVGCPTESSKVLVECLKKMEPSEILKKMTKLNPLEFNTQDAAHFGPSIEKLLSGQTENDVAVSDMPYKLLTSGKIVNKVPVIIGVNNLDGLTPKTAKVLNSTEALKTLNDKWEEVGPKTLFFDELSKDPLLVAKKIREFYFGDKEISFDTREQLLSLYTDRYFAGPARYSGRKLSKHLPVYLYYFDHKPKHSALEGFGFPKELAEGAAHLDETQYLVSLHDGITKEGLHKKDITKDDDLEEYTLSVGMVQLWASFFENGKPTKTWGDGKEWKKIEDAEKPQWYNINLQTKMMEEQEKFSKRVQFWHELYEDLLTPELTTPKDDTFSS